MAGKKKIREKPYFKLGQIWINMDERVAGKEVQIVGFVFNETNDLKPTWALCHTRPERFLPWGTRLTRIKLTRFKEQKNGYKLSYSPAQGAVVTL